MNKIWYQLKGNFWHLAFLCITCLVKDFLIASWKKKIKLCLKWSLAQNNLGNFILNCWGCLSFEVFIITNYSVRFVRSVLIAFINFFFKNSNPDNVWSKPPGRCCGSGSHTRLKISSHSQCSAYTSENPCRCTFTAILKCGNMNILMLCIVVFASLVTQNASALYYWQSANACCSVLIISAMLCDIFFFFYYTHGLISQRKG